MSLPLTALPQYLMQLGKFENRHPARSWITTARNINTVGESYYALSY